MEQFSVTFKDGSEFNLPEHWKPVFADYAGQNPEHYPALAERLRLLVSKYEEHETSPNRFDGILCREYEPDDIQQLDDNDFYMEEAWIEGWGGSKYLDRETQPKQADIAEKVLYHAMRRGILQQAFQKDDPEGGGPLVVGPAQAADGEGTRPYLVTTANRLESLLFS